LVAVAPVVRLVLAPSGAQTVVLPTDPIDVGALDRLRVGPEWQKVDVVAPVVQDAWTTARDVVLGAAWLRRPADGKLEALSAVCPHLGCAVDYDTDVTKFKCPCHHSEFNLDGKVEGGPAPRAMDELELEEKDGTVAVRYQRFRQGIGEKEVV